MTISQQCKKKMNDWAIRFFLEEEKQMKYILHKKDAKFFCSSCDDLVMQTNRDIVTGSLFLCSAFYQDIGQGPFVSGQVLTCKKCLVGLNPNHMRIENTE